MAASTKKLSAIIESEIDGDIVEAASAIRELTKLEIVKLVKLSRLEHTRDGADYFLDFMKRALEGSI